jgi:transglutaminase-like putative cysteine protease
VLIALTLVDAALVVKYVSDNRALAEFSRPHLGEARSASDKAKALSTAIRTSLPSNPNPRSFVVPVFRMLRATPRQVIEGGGECGDKSRLLIALLRLEGIESSKVALYDDAGIPRHAVVEVELEDGSRMVVDPLYNLFYPRPEGGYYSIRDMAADKSILWDRIEAMNALGKDGFQPAVKWYRKKQNTFRNPRTINWDKNALSRLAYRALGAVLGDRVNRLKRPYFVERPALTVLYAVLGLQGLVLVAFRKRLRFRSPPAPSTSA